MTSYPLPLNNPTPQELAKQLIEIIRGEYHLKGIVWDQGTWGETMPRFFAVAEEEATERRTTSGSAQELEKQNIYCGTAACVAGHAVLALGAVPAFGGLPKPTMAETFHDSSEMWCWAEVQYEGRQVEVAALAREALGLDRKQAAQLFDLANTADEVVELLEEIAQQDSKRIDL